MVSGKLNRPLIFYRKKRSTVLSSVVKLLIWQKHNIRCLMISEFHKSNLLSSKICTTAISVAVGSNGTFLHHFLASQKKANTSDNVFVRVIYRFSQG